MNNKILIVHHTDADGHCAAALVKYELAGPAYIDYYAYNYAGEIKCDVDSGTMVYLVDISMNDDVESFIKHCIDIKCKIVHIDHHKTSVEYYNENKIDDPNWVYFVHDENDTRNGPLSGCLLTFIYSCMNSDKRQHPMDVDFDLTELRDHLIFDGNTDMEYRVPFIVRLIDDHDVWRHKMNETKPFSYAYKRMPKEFISPDNEDMWEAIYNDNHRIIFQAIQSGERYIEDENERNEILRSIGGFETDIFGNHCYCINSLTAGSDQFGDEYDNHDMVCRFAYNGKGWSYSLYSSKWVVDCSAIAKEYGGGGHRGAAGFKLDYCIFGEDRPKKSIWRKIKEFFMH